MKTLFILKICTNFKRLARLQFSHTNFNHKKSMIIALLVDPSDQSVTFFLSALFVSLYSGSYALDSLTQVRYVVYTYLVHLSCSGKVE